MQKERNIDRRRKVQIGKKIIMMYRYKCVCVYSMLCFSFSLFLSLATLFFFFHLEPKQWDSSQHFLVWLFYVLIITIDVGFDFGWLNARENVTYTSALHHAEWSDLVAVLSWCTVRNTKFFSATLEYSQIIVHTCAHTHMETAKVIEIIFRATYIQICIKRLH